MMSEFLWSTDKIQKMRDKMETMPPVFSILRYPQLASLACCRGIQFELNTPMNRLTEFIKTDSDLPWLSRILKGDLGYKIEIYTQESSEFQLLKEELVDLISPESLDAQGRLTRIVFDPIRISALLESRHVDLVIVRDWILASALTIEPSEAVYYIQANPWEFKNNVGYRQCEMMTRHQLPFFGTHDLADHIAGSFREGLEKSHSHVLDTYKLMQQKFQQTPSSFCNLTYSYLLSLILDDLAQPRWHGNPYHEMVLTFILENWQNEAAELQAEMDFDFQIPPQFATIMTLLREVKSQDMLSPIYSEIKNLKAVWQGSSAAS